MTKERVEMLLRSAADANMNMLRVWGGGVYESDYFYGLADELGILIWQDFMYACNLYPVNEEFLETVRVETRQTVRRLHHHPSVALWAGNNENEVAILGWWPEIKDRKELYDNEYRKLYVDTVRRIVLEEDQTRPFVVSSPSNGVKSEQNNYLSPNPNDNRYGDVHFYDYNVNQWDWKKSPSTKFCSEYGIQALPSLDVWKKAHDSQQHDCFSYPFTDCIKHREHAPGGLENIMKEIQMNLNPPPANPVNGTEAFERIIFLSQVNQAMSIKTQSEFYRRNRQINNSTGEGMTYGALYWQLNDVWVAPTWASLDFYGGYKMLHYYAKEFFAPLIVVPFLDVKKTVDSQDQDIIRIHAVSDFMSPVRIRVTIQGYKLDSAHLSNDFMSDEAQTGWTTTVDIEMNPGSVQEVYSLEVSQFISESSCELRQDCILRVTFAPAQSTSTPKDFTGENFLLLSPPKDSEKYLKPSKVSVSSVTRISQLVYEITLKSESTAMFVWVSISQEDHDNQIRGLFNRNGFMMFDREQKITFTSTRYIIEGDLQKRIHIQSLN